MKGYKCRMGIEEGTYRDCPALDIGGCGFTAEEGPPANCDAIEYELIPAAVHDAQQTAIAAAEKTLRALQRKIETKKSPTQGDLDDSCEIANALAQLRAVKEAAGKCNS